MRTHECRSLSLLVVLSFSILTGPAHAQDADALRRELEALRQQFATVTASYEQRLKALGDRLQQLEGRAAPAPVPSPTTTAPAADAPTRADPGRLVVARAARPPRRGQRHAANPAARHHGAIRADAAPVRHAEHRPPGRSAAGRPAQRARALLRRGGAGRRTRRRGVLGPAL